MAESINMILESMLPHLEELQQIGIFQESEIRGIIKRRRQMEYKLFRRPSKKEDYIKAIEYELNLDRLRKLRKERMSAVTSQDGEFGIANRIHGLYRRSTRHFKGDINLWLKHIKYSLQLNQYNMTGRLFGRALAIHPTHVGLWIMAAKFEFEDRLDTAAARVLFQEGLRANSTSKKLWLEYYRMELLVVDKLRRRKDILVLDKDNAELPHDDVMNYAVISIVYNEAIRAIPNDIEFRLAFLPILVQFEDTQNKEQEIFDNLLSDFPTCALRHDAVARQHWLRLSDIDSLPVLNINELELETLQLYRKGITSLSNDIDQELVLWEKYILWFIQRLQFWVVRGEPSDNVDLAKLVDICNECSSRELLSESLARRVICVLQNYGLHEAASSLVQSMVTLYPSSCQLWLTRLHCEVVNSANFSSLASLCRDAISCVSKESSLQVWQFFINQAILGRSDDKVIESIFKECLKALPLSNNEIILLQYLDWAYVTRGIDHVWHIYNNMSELNPSVKVYLRLVSQQKSEGTVNASRICELFEAALNHHGTTSPELWLEYISTLTSLGGELMKEVGTAYWRAIKTLDGNYTSQFMSKHICGGLI